jgi:acetyl-CoA C-acetyltransferase
VVLGAVRTPIGRLGGAFKDVDAHEVGATCIGTSLDRAGIPVDEVDEVVMRQVGQVGRMFKMRAGARSRRAFRRRRPC